MIYTDPETLILHPAYVCTAVQAWGPPATHREGLLLMTSCKYYLNPPKVRKIMAFMAIIMGFGPLFTYFGGLGNL